MEVDHIVDHFNIQVGTFWIKVFLFHSHILLFSKFQVHTILKVVLEFLWDMEKLDVL